MKAADGEKITAPEPVKIHSGQDILTPFEDEAPVSAAQKEPVAATEAPSTAEALEAEAADAAAAANVEVQAAKDELKKLMTKKDTAPAKKSKKGKSKGE